MFLRRHNAKTATFTCSRLQFLVSWSLVLFFLLASGRALVPGLCATQRAMDAQCAVGTGGVLKGTTPSCCSVASGSESKEQDGSPRPVTPGESGCAFCKLAGSVAPVPASVAVPAPLAAAFAPVVQPTLTWATRFDERACPKRAPPA